MVIFATRAAIVAVAILSAGCSPKPPIILSDYCADTNAIIKPSRHDTAGTLRQVAASNEKHRTLCPDGSAP